MTTLLIGIMSVTLIGCSCLVPPQAMVEGCSSQGCFGRTAAAGPPARTKSSAIHTQSREGKSEVRNGGENGETITFGGEDGETII